MYTLYIANKNYSSWSLRPWVLMRELAIPFEEKIFSFEANAGGELFRTFSPTGKVPCLHDGARVVWDSLAITEYLAEREGCVWPEVLIARTWARSASAEMHSGFAALRDQCSMHCGFRIRVHAMSPELKQDINRIDAIWCEGLQRFGGPFLAGDKFTAVDAFYAPVAFRVQTYDLALSERAADYAKRLLALDSMRNWEVAALQETWRESAHEEAALGAGVLLADHRHR
jgi:glutathione S-transferase